VTKEEKGLLLSWTPG